MEVRLQALALRDLETGVRFYEKREPGSVRYFAETLWKEIASLAQTGGIHVKVYGKYHRFVSATFPFAVYYQVERDVIRVYAVFDCRRNPERLQARLR